VAVANDPNDGAHVTATCIANARLIAAAPELLAACKELTAFAKRQGWFHGAIESGEAAIAKAEGR
jgi:monoamine oxidase